MSAPPTENNGNPQPPHNSAPKTKQRILSIDIFRGIIICLMVIVNSMSHFEGMPIWNQHTPDFGLQYVDLGSPWFLFVIGLTYRRSFLSTAKREGYLEAYLKIFRRYGTLLGLGFIYNIVVTPEGIRFGWGVFQVLGLAGLATLCVIGFPKWVRFSVGIVLGVVYEVLTRVTLNIEGTLLTVSELNLTDFHGGIFGGVGFTVILILATAVNDDISDHSHYRLLLYGSIFVIFGLLYSLVLGVSMHRVSTAYVALSFGISCFTYFFFWFTVDRHRWLSFLVNAFQPVGKNAFACFLLHGVISGLIHIFPPTISPWLTWGLAFGNLWVVWITAYLLDKNHIYIIL